MDIIRHISSSEPLPACVATIGFFDGVHRGHRFLIEHVKAVALREQCRSAVVTFALPPQQVLNPSFSPQLISTYEEKLNLLEQSGIDECMVLDFTKELAGYSARQFMQDILKEQYGVTHLVIGYDHRFGHNRSEGFEDYIRYGKEIGVKVENIPAFEEQDRIVSSSAIRQLLLDGDISTANEALGYPYYLAGTVTSGHQVGRQIGFPTANIAVNSAEKIIPHEGVYAVRVEIEQHTYGGMLNIGHRPTIDNGDDMSIEVNIFHFDKDIYNCPIKVLFVDYIRPEQKFASIDQLEQQLLSDRQQIEAILS